MLVSPESPRGPRLSAGARKALFVAVAIGGAIGIPLLLSACGATPDASPSSTPGHNPQMVPCQNLPKGCPTIV